MVTFLLVVGGIIGALVGFTMGMQRYRHPIGGFSIAVIGFLVGMGLVGFPLSIILGSLFAGL